MDDLESVLACGVPPHRDAAAVVGHHDRRVGEDAHLDPGSMPGHRLVDRVVDDLPDEVMEPAGIGRANVHAGPPPHGLQTLEDLDAGRRVIPRGHAIAAA